MKKNKNIKKNSNIKKIQILLGVIIVVLIIVCVCKLMEEKPIENDVQEIQLPEFEKIAVYEYIEKNILQSDLLECYKQTEQSNNIKLKYAIQKCVEEQNKKNISEQDIIKKYQNLFQENIDSSIFMIPSPEINYQYDIETKEITVLEEVKTQTKMYKIEKIDTNGTNYFISVNIMEAKNKEEFMREYMQLEQLNSTEHTNDLNQNTLPEINKKEIEEMEEEKAKEYFMTILEELTQEQKEKLQQNLGSAKIELKVENEKYQIISYEENLKSDLII